LGAPPIVFPGVPMRHASVPAGMPGNAPVTPISQAAQRALGCGACGPAGPAVAGGIADLQPWYSKLPTWAKVGIGVGGAGVLLGIGYGVFRLVR
jgi:hypothetical protein